MNPMGLKFNCEKRNILLVVHSTTASGNAGVECYIDRFMEQAKDTYNLYLYVPDKKGGYYLLDAHNNLCEHVYIARRLDKFALQDKAREQAFANILRKYNIELVHYQHLIGHVPALPFISSSMGVKNVFTVHDFWIICKNYNLMLFGERYCGVTNNSLAMCEQCLAREGIGAGSQNKRRQFMDKLLGCMQVVIFNTNMSYELVKAVYPNISKAHCLINPVPNTSALVVLHPKDVVANAVLRVGIVANFHPYKGSGDFLEILKITKDERIEYNFFGRMNKRYAEDIDRLRLAIGGKNINVYGQYNVFPEAVADMDVVLYLSTCPETYCMTLSESWQRGVVPIVYDIGALGERVIEGENGFKVNVGDYVAVINLLKHMAIDRSLITNVRNKLPQQKLMIDTKEHLGYLGSCYQEILKTAENKNRVHIYLPDEKYWLTNKMAYEYLALKGRLKRSFAKYWYGIKINQ